MKKNLIKVDGKVFAKTLQFGNRKKKVVFKNKKAYNRKSLEPIFNQKFMTETTTTNTTEAKVFQLVQELDEMKKRKKAFNKAYNEEIKFLQKEIEELLNPEEKVELP